MTTTSLSPSPPHIPAICGHCGTHLHVNCPRLGSAAGHVHPDSGWGCGEAFEGLPASVKATISEVIRHVLAPYQAYLKAMTALVGLPSPDGDGRALWDAVTTLKERADEQDADEASWQEINSETPEQTSARLAASGITEEMLVARRRNLALSLSPEVKAELERLTRDVAYLRSQGAMTEDDQRGELS